MTPPQLCRILKQLLKHQLLFSFKSKLIECMKTLNADHKDLIPRMLIFITKIWSNQNTNTTVLLGAMIELYDGCPKDKWIKIQLQVVGRLCKLFSDDNFQLSDGSMNFWYTVLLDNIAFWQNRPVDSGAVADALKNVTYTHTHTHTRYQYGNDRVSFEIVFLLPKLYVAASKSSDSRDHSTKR